MAIGGSDVFTKVITLDASLSDEEMEGEIALQAPDHLPYPAAEASIDFEVLHLCEQDPTRIEVLLAACRREDADLLQSATATGGFRARVLDIDALAMARALDLLQPGIDGRPDTAIFDIGASSTTLSVIVDDKVVHTREHAFGGKLRTEEMQRRYDMSATEAELANSEVEDETILSRFRTAVLDQMTRALQFFYSANPAAHVDRILLAGGVAAMPALADHATRMLGSPVAVADPFACLTVSDASAAQELAGDAPAFMLACGLALRQFES